MTIAFQVKKRNGELEPFDQQKIARVVAAAGLTPDESRQLAASIASWVKASGKNPISSLAIRDKVIEEMKKINNYAAGLYQWYEKTKE